MMPEPVDIASALTHYHAEMGSDRPDDGRLHVADLTKCVREVWARRNGKEMYGFSLDTRRRFHQGHMVEKEILDALEEKYAGRYLVERDMLVYLYLDGDVLKGGACVEDAPGQYVELGPNDTADPIPEDAIIGHPDAVLATLDGETPILVEVKSTRFWDNGKSVPDKPTYDYAMQAAAYALALGITWAWVIVSCVISLLTTPSKAPFKFDANKYRTDITKAILERRDATKPGAPEPPPEPPSFADRDRPRPGQAVNWKCEYCNYGACQKNQNARGRSIT